MENVLSEIFRLCRVCKGESKPMLSLFESLENMEPSPRIDEMLMACTSIQIRLGDGLPTLICSPCSDLLRASYLFKKKCEDTDNDFKEYIKQIRKEDDFKPNVSQSTSNSELTSNLFEEIGNVIVNDVSDSSFLSTTTQPNFQSEIKDDPENNDFIEILDNCQILLTCPTCYKNFTTRDGLRNHKRLHTGDLFQCKVCSKVYTRQTHLQRHETTHKRHKVHICKICNKTLKRYEHLKRHLITHIKEKPFACKSCNRGFNRAEHLANHAVRCKGDKVFVCDICNKGFNREDSLEVHKKVHENKQLTLPTIEDLNNVEDYYFEIDFEDSSMLQTFADDGDNKRDCFEPQVSITENTNQQIDFYSSNLNKKEDEGIAIQKGRKEQYDTSEVISGVVENQHDHNFERIHHRDDPITETTKDNNVEIITKEEIEYDDDSSFMDNKPEVKNLKVENKTTVYPKQDDIYVKGGMSENTCTCKTCKKTFTSKSHLIEHMKFHNDHCKKFVCSECGQRFIRNDYLVIHMRRHKGEKPFKCRFCGKGFPRTTDLIVHERYHTGEKTHLCTICGRGFGRAYNLTVHMRTHTGEKPYQCTYCDAAFAQGNDLKAHIRRHTGERFHCDLCNESFLMGYLLTQHKRTVHGLNIVNNIQRLKPINKIGKAD